MCESTREGNGSVRVLNLYVVSEKQSVRVIDQGRTAYRGFLGAGKVEQRSPGLRAEELLSGRDGRAGREKPGVRDEDRVYSNPRNTPHPCAPNLLPHPSFSPSGLCSLSIPPMR